MSLGHTVYCRQFVKGYATIARPLNDLLTNPKALLKAQRGDARHKATFDLKVWHSTLHEGDRVLVQNVRLQSKP